MPQASDSLRKQMRLRFGDLDTSGPETYLSSAGYVLRSDWTWKPKPYVNSLRDMTRQEFDCLLFLMHEWDYGGLRP